MPQGQGAASACQDSMFLLPRSQEEEEEEQEKRKRRRRCCLFDDTSHDVPSANDPTYTWAHGATCSEVSSQVCSEVKLSVLMVEFDFRPWQLPRTCTE